MPTPQREVTVKEQYKVMAAMLALREFTTADLANFSGVTDSTIRTILNRHRAAYDEVMGAETPRNRDRGGQYKTFRLKPEAITEFRQQLMELQDIVGRAVAPGPGAHGAATPPSLPESDMTERLREPVELIMARDLLLRRIPESEASLRRHLLYDADLALRAARRVVRSYPGPGGDAFRLALDALVAAQNYLNPKPNEERSTVESLLDFAGKLSILGQKEISTELIAFATNALAERVAAHAEIAGVRAFGAGGINGAP